MEVGRFKDLMAGFQSLFVCLAVVIGGLWTIYLFDVREEAQKAKVDHETAKAAYEKLARELHEKRVINIKIKSSQITGPDKGLYILAEVEISNIGTHTEKLYWNGPPFVARRLRFDQDSNPACDAPEGLMLPSFVSDVELYRVLPGEVLRIPCMARVKEPGFYYVSFSIRASPPEQLLARQEGIDKVRWESSTCVVVRPRHSDSELFPFRHSEE